MSTSVQSGQQLIAILCTLQCKGSTHQVLLLFVPVYVCREHEAYSFIEHVYLMRLQILDGHSQLCQQL